jgi:hypothetical protein
MRTSKGSIYSLIVVGQRFIESEYLTNRNSNDDCYFYKRLVCFYVEFVISKSLAVKIGLAKVSEKSEARETTTEREVSRITTVDQTGNPLYSSSVESDVVVTTMREASRITIIEQSGDLSSV